ncbi:Endoplasmic reticulum junction formation protein lunapark [Abortiporus biennis]
MGLFSGWFKKSQREDYEQVLASLASDIQKRQTRLSEIRLRERRSTLNFSLIAFSLWVAWVSLWYMDYLPNLSHHPRKSTFEKAVRGIPVFVGPIIILFIRRIVQIWYHRIGDAEEKHLIALRKQQREKIEQIKKQTNYYTTKTLLERYEGTPGPDSPLRARFPPQGVPGTPQRPLQPQPRLPPQTPAQTPQAQPPAIPANLLSPSPQRPLPPPRKQWLDKLADAILGDDDASSPNAAASRYALICQKCFAHNGLVKESVWEDTQYVCPKCGHFNPSARALRAARAGGRLSVSPPRASHPSSPNNAVGMESVHTSPGPDSRNEKRRSRISEPAPRVSRNSRDFEEVSEGASAMEVDS